MAWKNGIIGGSILDADNKLEAINALLSIGIKWIHYDVMDGDFVPKVSLPPYEVRALVLKADEHIVDIHLMVKDVNGYIQQFKDIADYITFHFEAINEQDLISIFEKYSDLNLGLAIKPHTPLSAIKHYLPFLTHVLIMSVEPGLGGQKFIQTSYEKIMNLKHLIEQENLNLFIGVDGGINQQTGPQAIVNGASMLISGSYLLKNLSKETINKILKQSSK